MAITVVSASYEAGIAQVDGRHWITETLILSEGDPVTLMYLADIDCDLDAHLATSVK